MKTRRSFQKGYVTDRRGKWIIRWRERVLKDGKLAWAHRLETLGATSSMTKGEARKILLERRNELNPLAHFPARETTLEQLGRRWEQESLPNKSLPTQAGYRKLLKKHILAGDGLALVCLRLPDLSPGLVQRFVSRKTEAGLSPQTVRNIYHLLRSILRFGIRLKLLMENPSNGVELPKKLGPRQERAVYTPEQVSAILTAFEQQGDLLSRTLILSVYFTGLRRSELCGLRWQDADLQRKEIRPQRAVWNGLECDLKSAASYSALPIPEILRDALLELRLRSRFANPCDPVFVGPGGKPMILANWVRRKLRPVLRQLALPMGALHSFRHTRSTRLNFLGVDPRTLQALNRHADVGVTFKHYTHLVPGVQRQAVDLMEAEFLAACGNLCSTGAQERLV